MNDNKQFSFVRDVEEIDKLKVVDEKHDDTVKYGIHAKKLTTSEQIIKILKVSLFMLLQSAALFILIMLWQDDWSLMAIGDGLWFVCIFEFFIGWALLVYNWNIFSPLVYGFKTFLGMFIGKRPKTDYYSFMKNVQENQVPARYYMPFFITSFILFIPALIILFIVL